MVFPKPMKRRRICKIKTNYGRMIFLSLSIKISLGYETVILPKNGELQLKRKEDELNYITMGK